MHCLFSCVEVVQFRDIFSLAYVDLICREMCYIIPFQLFYLLLIRSVD